MATQEQRRPLVAEPGEPMAARIDWRLPETRRDDWLFGTGATPIEQGLVWVTAVLGLGLIIWQGVFTPPPGWAWWHHMLSAVILLDVAGGAVAKMPLANPRSAGRYGRARREISASISYHSGAERGKGPRQE